MEVKELNSVTVDKLDGDLYAVDGKICRSFRAAIDAIADALEVERRKRKPATKPSSKK